jgi:predicted alpha/beta-fold hydrolase
MNGNNSIRIKGYRDLPVSTTFMEAKTATSKLAVFFPGRGYTNQMPLLHFTSKLMHEKEFDVLLVNCDYGQNNDFVSSSESEQKLWITEDSRAVIKAILDTKSYQEIVLVGKSLGTYSLCKVVPEISLPEVKLIWLTPTLRNAEVYEMLHTTSFQSLLIIGTDDPHYDAGKLETIQSNQNVQIELYEGANHSMEHEIDTTATGLILQDIIQKTTEFI